MNRNAKNNKLDKFLPPVGVLHQWEILQKVIFLKEEIEKIREQVQNIE